MNLRSIVSFAGNVDGGLGEPTLNDALEKPASHFIEYPFVQLGIERFSFEWEVNDITNSRLSSSGPAYAELMMVVFKLVNFTSAFPSSVVNESFCFNNG